MLGRIDGWAPLAAGLLLAAVLAPTTALAHGEEGDHVASFQDHLDDYEADVEKLASRLDKLVERYRRDGAVPAREVPRLVASGPDWSLSPALNEVVVQGP
ncbi:MAG: hypothetical protein ABEJ96_05935, partial [Thiohalorhabdaceae bacterium]